MYKKIGFFATLLCIAFVAGSMGNQGPTINTNDNSDGIDYHSLVTVYKNGEMVGNTHNVLTNAGKNYTISQMFDTPSSSDATDLVTTIQLGNGSAPSASDTSHPGLITDCGLSEYTTLNWSPVSTSDGNISTSHEWESECNNLVVNTTGLVTATDDTYFAGASLVDVTLQSADKINITYRIWIT